MEGYEKDIDDLTVRMNKIDQRVARMESSSDFFKDVLKKNTETNEKLNDTLSEVKSSIFALNSKMESHVKVIEDMDVRFTQANAEASRKIDIIDEKLQQYEDKSKFDIMMFLKHNWGWIMVLLGMGILYVSEFVKF